MSQFERHFGYAIDKERPDELDANGLDPEQVLRTTRAAHPNFNPYADPWNQLMNQRSIGSCQGCSLAHLTQIMVAQQVGRHAMFSGMQAYIMSQRVDGIRGDSGSTLSGGQKVAKTEGICMEKHWPYPSRYSANIPNGYDEFPRVRIPASKRITDVDLAWDLLSAGAALHIGATWGRCMEQQVCDRYYGPVAGGHATFLYGLVEGSDNAIHHNSWGPNFGTNGRNQYTKTFFKELMRQRWTVVIAYQPTDLEVDERILDD